MSDIGQLARQALQLFRECYEVSCENLPEQDPRSAFEDLQGRFRSWCGGLGALQHGRASLDWRLRDSETMSARILKHIRSLIEDLEDCQVVLVHGQQAYEPVRSDSVEMCSSEGTTSEDDSSDSRTELDEHLLSLEHTIESLYKLSFLIRNYKSKQSAFRKAESYGLNTDGVGSDLFAHFKPYDYDRASNFIEQLRRDRGYRTVDESEKNNASLFNRLSAASSKRRRQFAYWTKHSKKLDSEHSAHRPKTSGEGQSGPGTILSSTVASSFHGDDSNDDHEVQSSAPSASTAWGMNGDRVSWPKPPELAEGETAFECPYCHVMCRRYETDRRAWRKHLFEDLRPYMCTYTGCATGEEMYGSRKEWVSHEEQTHRQVWICREHPNEVVRSQEAFREHLKSQHPDMEELQIDTSCTYSGRTLDDTRSRCPMCLIPVAQLPRSQSLVNHIAYHFEVFALPSLPSDSGEAGDEEDDDDDEGETGPIAERRLYRDDISDSSLEDFKDANEPIGNDNIHSLAQSGDKFGLRTLLDKNKDVDAEDEEGWTALQRATNAGQRETSQMLLSAGADVDHSSGLYGNALQIAASRGDQRMLRLLIDCGANVNIRGGVYGTALLAATMQGHDQVVQMLLVAGARVITHGVDSKPEAAPTEVHTKIVQTPAEAGSRRPTGAVGDAALPTVLPQQYTTHDETRRNQPSPNLTQSIDPRTGVETIFQSSPQTPKDLKAEGIFARRGLFGSAGNAERLFPAFVVRPSKFFCVGRVFLVLWAEPAEQSTGTVVTTWQQGTVLNHLGESVFSKFRRFVVVREGADYCSALPITTYGGRGVAKPGVVKSQHAIIYTGKDPPQPRSGEAPSRGEAGMRPQPIRVDPDATLERLDPMSRIDFRGVHTVQHKIKTKSLGMVSKGSVTALQTQFADVWQDQIRLRSKLAEGVDPAEESQRTRTMAGSVGSVHLGSSASRTLKAPNDGSDDDTDENGDTEADDEGEGSDDGEVGGDEVDSRDK